MKRYRSGIAAAMLLLPSLLSHAATTAEFASKAPAAPAAPVASARAASAAAPATPARPANLRSQVDVNVSRPSDSPASKQGSR